MPVNAAHVRSELRELTERFAAKYLPEFGYKVEIHEEIGEMPSLLLQNGIAKIVWKEKCHYFRLLGHLLQGLKDGKSNIELYEKPYFDTLGAMLDMSRGGVMRVESVKRYMEYMAIMGYNTIMLYTEDTYEIKEYPYFGYMRGRYTKEELAECCEYAEQLGIEVIPCIQTLGHMEQYLKWRQAGSIMDTERVLLAGSDHTYKFIEDEIKAVRAAFKSDRVHIGMDEAWDLGLGRYLTLNGYETKYKILSPHLSRVVEIAKKYGLKPMMWSDMFFRAGSKSSEYYDTDYNIPQKIIDEIPEVDLVYWDYYHTDYGFYDNFIKKHKNMGKKVVFGGGVWTWAGHMPNYGITYNTMKPALQACKDNGVKEVLATLWGDDGCETNYFFGLLGLQLFAEYCYRKDTPTDREVADRFNFCTNADAEAFMQMSRFHDYDGECSEFIGKKALYQDIMTGLLDYQLIQRPISTQFKDVAEKLAVYDKKDGEWKDYYSYARQLFEVCSLKCFVAERLKTAYDKNDTDYLSDCAKRLLPELKEKIIKLRNIHQQLWLKDYKPFGWEVIDGRYGALSNRVDYAASRLLDYLSGNVNMLEELAEERLPFDNTKANIYSSIYTAYKIMF